MTNKTGCIVGRLSETDIIKVIVGSEDRDIRAKFMNLLGYFPQQDDEDLVISEHL